MRRSWKTMLVVAVASILTAIALVRGPLRTPVQSFLAPAPADGYRYTKSEGTTLLGGDGRYQILIHFERQIWIGRDGSGRMLERRDRPTFFGVNDKAEWKDAPFDETVDEIYEPNTLTYVSLDDLPRDASALRAYLVQKADQRLPAASEIYTQARTYLWETVPPPDLSRAFRTVLTAEPGVDAFEQDGRVALTLVQGSPPQVQLVMVLDNSGALVHEQRSLLIAAPPIDAAPPVSVGYTDYLAAQIVDHLSAP